MGLTQNLGLLSTAMKASSTLNVGIGTSSPSRKLSIESSDIWMSYKVTGAREYLIGMGTSDAFRIFDATADSERMRITSGGSVCIGTSSAFNSAALSIQYDANTYNAIVTRPTNSYSAAAISFQNILGGGCGYIATSASTTSYVTTSDYRLKEDLKEFNGLDKVSAIKVYNFKWKNSEDRMDGVIAHELSEVLPYAVHGQKDGKENQGVDYSKIVPVLVKAIQELKAENDNLKSILTRNNIN